MTLKTVTIAPKDIQNKIYTMRGLQVMLDRDLAELYQVETKVLNQTFKRNKARFPDDFVFQLTADENKEILRSQFVTSKKQGTRGGRRYLPYAFTEQGVAMLSAVLKSDTAINVSLNIIRAFVAIRKFLANNTVLLNRLNRIELKQMDTDQKFDRVFKALEERSIQPQKGIFFEGQIFDAYIFISKLIKQAKKSIILIDNYIDESVLTLLTKRTKNVTASIYTKEISQQFQLDLKKHNAQYPAIEIHLFKDAHDRFLILDNTDVYHIGASIKDLGKKWFAFSKFDKAAIEMIKKINKKGEQCSPF